MSDGVYYECQRCTNCCRWPGFVKVDDVDIAALARFLEMSEHDFIQRYTRLRPQRNGLAPLPGRITCGSVFRWLTPPADFHDASGVRCVWLVPLGNFAVLPGCDIKALCAN